MSLSFYQALHKFNNGFAFASLLRNRGRSRQFVSSRITQLMRTQLSQLKQGTLQLPTSGNDSYPVISLTSWRLRFDSLPLVLLNLLAQDLLPSRILVWLSEGDYDLFDPVMRHQFEKSIVEFRKTKDFGPHKKWLPLTLLSSEPFVISDDDIFYPSNWYRSLLESDDKIHCIAHRCHRLKLSATDNILPYESWDKDVMYASGPSHNLFAVGCGGLLVYPDRISSRFRSWENIEKNCPKADDIWLKLAHIDSDTPIKKTPYMLPCLEYLDSQDIGLLQSNVNLKGNDVQLKKTIQDFQLNLSMSAT